MLVTTDKIATAYIIGIALGDGNLSNPNGRAVRLRITCDTKYPRIVQEIVENLQKIAPCNKVSIVERQGNCLDISCYSNDWENLLGWSVGEKIGQKISVPKWIHSERGQVKACLRGLLQSDGSIYFDRKYLMVNFVNCCRELAFDVLHMIESLGFSAKMSVFQQKNTVKYTVRVVRRSDEFIDTIGLHKS